MSLFLSAAVGFLAALWRPRLAFPIAAVGTAAALAAALFGLATTLREGRIEYVFGSWPRPLGIEYILDPLSGTMVVLVTFFGFICILYGRRQVDALFRPMDGYYYGLLLLLLTGLSGIVLTGDVFNLFVFLEISSLATYALIATGGQRATVAAFRYLLLGTVGASLYLLGVGFIFFQTGTLNMAHLAELLPELYGDRSVFVGLALIVTGLGLKTAIYPLHIWLPDSYAYSPPPVATLIAAVATKVGAYAMIRLLFWMFDPTYIAEQIPVTRWILWLSMLGIIIASIQAMPQKDFRRLLAFSSVSQIGFIGLGIGLATPLSIVAAVFHIINHAVMKACLFMAAGYINFRFGKDSVSDLAGIGGAMPWTAASVLVAGLSLIGIPPTGGFFSKWYLIQAAVTEQEWLPLVVILAGSLLTAAYVFRILRYIFLTPPAKPFEARQQPQLLMVVPMVALAATAIVLGLANVYFVEGILKTALPGGWQ